MLEKTRNPRNLPIGTSAGGIVLKVAKDNTLFIGLIKEGEKDAWVLPKGHVEPDESLVKAAKREVQEELGINPNDIELVKKIGTIERESFEGDEWKTTHFFLFKLRDNANESKFIGRWFPLNHLPEMFWREQEALIKSNQQVISDII